MMRKVAPLGLTTMKMTAMMMGMHNAPSSNCVERFLLIFPVFFFF